MTLSLDWLLSVWARAFLAFTTLGASTAPVPSDVELVRAAQEKGERGRHAFDVLVERYHQPIYRQLYRLTRRPGTADDLTQETFVKAYLELPKLNEAATFPAWLRRIATRLAFNARREAKTRSTYEERAELSKAELGGRRSSPEETAGATELVWMTLGKLAYPYREILVLRYLEELSVDEICDQLDLGKSATKMRLKRARDDFKQIAERLSA